MQYINFVIMYTKLYMRLSKASALSSLGGVWVAVGTGEYVSEYAK